MSGRILIADDVATNRIIIKVKLASASYDVCHAATEDELLHSALHEQPDLILLDSGFQSDRGIDLCHELQINPKTWAIPVLIIASNYTAADRLAALHAGASDILSKPIDDAVLLARVRNTLRVRGVEEELRLREGTAAALGFHESAATFAAQPQILVIDGEPGFNLQWRKIFETSHACHFTQLRREKALDTIRLQNLRPDLIVLPAVQRAGKPGLFILAELRNRPETRHSAIVVLDSTGDEHAAISALDMGANDVLDARTPAAEFSFRMSRHLDRKLKSDQLRDTLKDGLRMAVTDPLTGLFNRRYALPHLARIAEKAALTGAPFAVMVLDLDRFKRINDTYGHGAGDLVLKEVATRLQANVRSVDLIARIGGEEFLVVMPDTNMKAATAAAERLRRVTQENPIALSGGTGSISVTTSIGVSIGGLAGTSQLSVENMVDRADQALLGAKSTGRNQVIVEQSAA